MLLNLTNPACITNFWGVNLTTTIYLTFKSIYLRGGSTSKMFNENGTDDAVLCLWSHSWYQHCNRNRWYQHCCWNLRTQIIHSLWTIHRNRSSSKKWSSSEQTFDKTRSWTSDVIRSWTTDVIRSWTSDVIRSWQSDVTMPQFMFVGENYLIRPEFGIQNHFDEVAASIETLAFEVTF